MTSRRVAAVGHVLVFDDLGMLQYMLDNDTHVSRAKEEEAREGEERKRREAAKRPRFTKFSIRLLTGGELSAGPVAANRLAFYAREIGRGGRSGILSFTSAGVTFGAKAGGYGPSTASEMTTTVPLRLENLEGLGRIASAGIYAGIGFGWTTLVFYCGGNLPVQKVEGWGGGTGLAAGASWTHGAWTLELR